MTRAESISLFFLILWAVVMWAGLIFVIPWCTRSLARYRLWELRDELYDDIRKGILPNEGAPSTLLRNIENAIRRTVDLTMFELGPLALGSILSGHWREWVKEAGRGRTKLTDDELRLLKKYEHRFAVIILRQITFGTPSGWVGAPLLFILVLITRRRPVRYAERRVAIVTTAVAESDVHSEETERPLSAHAT
jgi:hypothetical protein